MTEQQSGEPLAGEVLTTAELAQLEEAATLATGRELGDLRRNPGYVFLARKPRSLRTYLEALGKIVGIMTGERPEGREAQLAAVLAFPWHTLTYAETSYIRAKLEAGWGAKTATRDLSPLRGVLKVAWRLGLMTEEQRARAADVENITGESDPPAAGRAVTEGEKAALLRACANDKSPAGARDLALLGLGIALGYRRAEPIALDMSHYDPTTGGLVIHGKRNKSRTLYVKNNARRYLETWLAVRGPEPGPMFCPVNKGGRVQIRRMTPQAFYNMLAKRAAEAGVVGITPHDMRRTLAGDLLDAGADLATVSKMLGHSSIQTTAGYDRRGERAKERAAELIHLPYYQWAMLEEGEAKQ